MRRFKDFKKKNFSVCVFILAYIFIVAQAGSIYIYKGVIITVAFIPYCINVFNLLTWRPRFLTTGLLLTSLHLYSDLHALAFTIVAKYTFNCGLFSEIFSTITHSMLIIYQISFCKI